MTTKHRLIAVLALPLMFACSDDGGENQPMFTSASGSQTTTMGMETDTDMSESSSDSMSGGDGDGDPAGDGDGEGTSDTDPTDSTDTDPTTDPSDSDTTDSSGDGDGDPECATDPSLVGGSCGEAAGMKGAVNLGESLASMPVGSITEIDDGLGNGDWYQVQFPMDANMRPMGGTPTISFAVNDGGNYRFQLYRDCGEQPYSQGLASEFGSGAPPTSEWSFYDLTSPDEQANYVNNVNWPSSVWIRVFRFQNAGNCDTYQLQVDHLQ